MFLKSLKYQQEKAVFAYGPQWLLLEKEHLVQFYHYFNGAISIRFIVFGLWLKRYLIVLENLDQNIFSCHLLQTERFTICIVSFEEVAEFTDRVNMNPRHSLWVQGIFHFFPKFHAKCPLKYRFFMFFSGSAPPKWLISSIISTDMLKSNKASKIQRWW